MQSGQSNPRRNMQNQTLEKVKKKISEKSDSSPRQMTDPCLAAVVGGWGGWGVSHITNSNCKNEPLLIKAGENIAAAISGRPVESN